MMAMNIGLTQISFWPVVGGVLIVLLLVLFFQFVGSFVLIRERQVGIVVKKLGSKTMAAGRLIALEGEAGYQAATLAPGLHFGYWPFQYRVMKVPHLSFCTPVANNFPSISQAWYDEELKRSSGGRRGASPSRREAVLRCFQ